MKIFQILLLSSALAALMGTLSACSSDDPEDPDNTNTLIFKFTAKVDDEELVFDTKKYQTPAQQIVSFERLQFYLSNIQVKDAKTGTYYSEPESYRLLSFDADQGAVSFSVENIPADFEISEIKMAIGVDADANTSIDHVGDLDPTNGMAWDWNTGYKFLSLDGRYFADQDPLGQELKMHIGTDRNYASVSLTFEEPMVILGEFTMVYTVDAMAPFGNSIDLEQGTVFMNDERGNEVADNYRSQLLQLDETYGFVKN